MTLIERLTMKKVLTDKELQEISVYPWEKTTELMRRVEAAVLNKICEKNKRFGNEKTSVKIDCCFFNGLEK